MTRVRQPWMTIVESADYLRWSRDWIERNLVPYTVAAPEPGKLRYVRMASKGHRVRVLAEDVYAILPCRVAGNAAGDGKGPELAVIGAEAAGRACA